MIDFGNIIKESNIAYWIQVLPDKPSGRLITADTIEETDDFSFDDLLQYIQDNPERIIDDLSTPEMTIEMLANVQRFYRDEKIKAVEWRVRRYQDEMLLGLNPTDDIVKLAAYIQALREVPQQPGFPSNIVWPVLEIINE